MDLVRDQLSKLIYKKAYPVSFAVINLINYPTFVEKAVAIFKPFISEKLLSRVILMKDTDEIRKVIGNVSLPVEYNGTTSLTQKESSDLMKQNLINIREYILKCDSIKCKEVKKTDEKVKCYQEMDDGVAGSFRKLTID
uniref:CRAL-TRIO domain-containing protein n=1 Tax=Rhodnius prolixus TaxID=13249 RepID=T1I1R4_RHOPR